MMKRKFIVVLITTILGCSSAPSSSKSQVAMLATVSAIIQGQPFELWVADDYDERLRGLMFVTAKEMVPKNDGTERGMLFAFDTEQTGSFWMKDTFISLDIAYLRSDGTVIRTYTMAPLDTRTNQYPPGEPYLFAIEVNGGRFSELGLVPGDRIEISLP